MRVKTIANFAAARASSQKKMQPQIPGEESEVAGLIGSE